MTALRNAKGLWMMLAVAVLGITLYLGGPDADIAMVWAMLLLGFPGSVLVTYCYAGIAFVWHTYIAGPQALEGGRGLFSLFVTVVWTGFFLVGYVQWFVLLPFVVRRWRSARERH